MSSIARMSIARFSSAVTRPYVKGEVLPHPPCPRGDKFEGITGWKKHINTESTYGRANFTLMSLGLGIATVMFFRMRKRRNQKKIK